MNLKGYVVKDAAGNKFTFPATHKLQPGDYIKLRGNYGTDIAILKAAGFDAVDAEDDMGPYLIRINS